MAVASDLKCSALMGETMERGSSATLPPSAQLAISGGGKKAVVPVHSFAS